jgi:nicotinamide-nucleotide amidase
MNEEMLKKVEIIAVGSELLTPYFQDTNSLFLTKHLNDLGLNVTYKTIVGDDWDDLAGCIQTAILRADIIIATGGLGPTRDDRTREAAAYVLGRKLLFRRDLFQKIEKRFKRRKLIMPEVNKKQAYIIEGSEHFENKNGTAPGLWIKADSALMILLPGPPHEIEPMFEESVLPRLLKMKTGYSVRRVVKIVGLTESKVETLINDLHPKSAYLSLATLAYPGQIELHLTSTSTRSREHAEREIEGLREKLVERFGGNVFSCSEESLEETVGKLLKGSKSTVATAESCTGGLLGHRITNVSGSSDYFIQGAVVYSNEAKSGLLKIDPDVILKHGAVSGEVAGAMAVRVQKIANTDYGLSITGIAGPEGGTAEKPVGLVFIALAWKEDVEVTKNLFLGNRETIKFQSTQKALDLLRRHLIKV